MVQGDEQRRRLSARGSLRLPKGFQLPGRQKIGVTLILELVSHLIYLVEDASFLISGTLSRAEGNELPIPFSAASTTRIK
jgi:hypothetical protein